MPSSARGFFCVQKSSSGASCADGKGVCGGGLISVAIFDAYFRGADNVACIHIEAHLVENLKAKLLVGMDVIGHEGFRLDFHVKTVKIPSYIGLEVPISTYAKPYHVA